MRRIGIADADQALFSQPAPHLHARGAIRSHALFDSTKDPIHVWRHRAGGDAALTVDGGVQGRILYTWHGEPEVLGVPVAPGGAIVVEHGARAVLTCSGDVELVEFVPAAARPAPARAGGGIHILCGSRVERSERDGVSAALLAGQGCATCELWLHENRFVPGGLPNEVHCHAADEVIFVTAGTMIAGRRALRRGAALAVAANTYYGFGVGPDGLRFINFRPAASAYAMARERVFRDELTAMQSMLGLTIASHLSLRG
jgi:hypothetical protein